MKFINILLFTFYVVVVLAATSKYLFILCFIKLYYFNNYFNIRKDINKYSYILYIYIS